jgi:uncharacterized C2H2 Zn-finger protein
MFMRIIGTVVSVLALTLVLPLGLLFVELANLSIAKHSSPYLPILAMVGWLVFGNLMFLTLVRVLKCPHCGKRFGWRNYMTGMFAHVWPNRRCPNCGADTYQSRKDYVKDISTDLRSRS